jgi:hypothetical protein
MPDAIKSIILKKKILLLFFSSPSLFSLFKCFAYSLRSWPCRRGKFQNETNSEVPIRLDYDFLAEQLEKKRVYYWVKNKGDINTTWLILDY